MVVMPCKQECKSPRMAEVPFTAPYSNSTFVRLYKRGKCWCQCQQLYTGSSSKASHICTWTKKETSAMFLIYATAIKAVSKAIITMIRGRLSRNIGNSQAGRFPNTRTTALYPLSDFQFKT
ncbi:hypothetical protein NQ317_006120 [Molorchus minor]|uniref:Uncharacterized protein n=1 Tax=Molorchus minor TaxID=1323400 RepID=A0ABQ9JK07_9CUCU|nr:hypothetical protein NQ317_006120 [Molorchus minor]